MSPYEIVLHEMSKPIFWVKKGKYDPFVICEFAQRVVKVNALSGMTNSVDPDQTAPEQSDLDLHCLHMISSENIVNNILGHLP